MKKLVKKVYPIKDTNVLNEVKATLKDSFKYGVRNYTIFQVGKATLLRVSDVLSLRYDDVYNANGTVKNNVYIHDQKTGKPNRLYLNPVKSDLLEYRAWLKAHNINSMWLFPSIRKPNKHIDEQQFYKVMAKVGDLLGIDYLGTHTMRKTGAYLIYQQTNHNIALVMKLLNHSSEKMTLAYLGLDVETTENILNTINFN